MSVRKKNALTEHYIAPLPEGDEAEPEYMRLSKWIHTIEPSPEEETEEEAFYDGDGTPETDVISVKKGWEVEGYYLDSDPAHKFIRDIEFETGEGRKIMYKQVRQNGDVLEGIATVVEPNTTGGEAQAHEPLTCTITWDRRPEIKKADDEGK